VDVVGGTAGTLTNTLPAGGITSSVGGNAVPASALLTVLALPTAVKAFTPPSILVGGTSTLSITMTNTNTTAVTGVEFTDNYPLGLINGSSPPSTTCGTGTVTATSGGAQLALLNGTIPAATGSVPGVCEVTVSVTSSVAGGYMNTTGAVSSVETGPGATASATLTVTDADLKIEQEYALTGVRADGLESYVTFTITISNEASETLLNALFTDPLVSRLGVISVECGALGGAICPSSVLASDMQGSGVSIPSLPPGGSVTFTVKVAVVTKTGPVANVVSVSTPSGVIDSNPTNNTAKTWLLPDLKATKRAPLALQKGANFCETCASPYNVGFLLGVSNVGVVSTNPSDLVTLVDLLPTDPGNFSIFTPVNGIRGTSWSCMVGVLNPLPFISGTYPACTTQGELLPGFSYIDVQMWTGVANLPSTPSSFINVMVIDTTGCEEREISPSCPPQ